MKPGRKSFLAPEKRRAANTRVSIEDTSFSPRILSHVFCTNQRHNSLAHPRNVVNRVAFMYAVANGGRKVDQNYRTENAEAEYEVVIVCVK